jgi:transposase InsO family protein
MEARMRFVMAVLAQEDSMSALCEEYGVSRRIGYKWIWRYQREGVAGLVERRRGPRRVPWSISQAQVEAIIGLRRAHPSWGPKKLRGHLASLAPQERWPALSTIGDLLARQGLSARRARRRKPAVRRGRLRPALAPNDIWSVDFKGWFRTGDGAQCYPLTATDAFSRYILCCGATSPDYVGCRREFERLFGEYGLPATILSDNGPPFASQAAGGLSLLSVWWVKLGIQLQRIVPGKPQQNGRHERMHRTLKAETATPPAASLAAQRRRFERFVAEFNHQRPHEALGLSTPALHYTRSLRSYPARLEDPEYPAGYERRRVRTNGEIKWQGELVFIAGPLSGEVIGLREDDQGDATAYFGAVELGTIDGLKLRFAPVCRRGV